ncbi:MAG: hypothetical protein IT426_03170 [Pirellulales bacterium]|nr:hypothetical protein [Pirellulales bacterium]
MEQAIQKKKSKPILFFIVGTSLAMVAFWFGMATINYDAETSVFPFVTAGWFVLGFPFVVGFSLFYAIVLYFLFRRLGKLFTWLAMLTVSTLLIAYSIDSSLPRNQIRVVLGDEIAKQVSIIKLRISDSFRDGRTYFGLIRGPKNLIQTLKKRFSLKIHENDAIDPNNFEMLSLPTPKSTTTYSDDRRTFYVSENSEDICFVFRTYINSPDGER